MQVRWLKAKEWWSGLALREKQAVALGASILGIFILYQGIWSPYLASVASLRAHLTSQQKTLLWMQAADQAMQKMEEQTKAPSKSMSPVVFLSYLQKRIEAAGLVPALTQLKQASNDSIAVQFKKVEFDKLMALLISVIKEQHVTVTQMQATAESAIGVVNVSMMLKLG